MRTRTKGGFVASVSVALMVLGGGVAIFGDDCPGGWLTGPYYNLRNRPCSSCLTPGTGNCSGDCSSTSCTGSFPNEICPCAGAYAFRAGTSPTPCNCSQYTGNPDYALALDENGNVRQTVCADVYSCSTLCMHGNCWRPSMQSPTIAYCSISVLTGSLADCTGG